MPLFHNELYTPHHLNMGGKKDHTKSLGPLVNHFLSVHQHYTSILLMSSSCHLPPYSDVREYILETVNLEYLHMLEREKSHYLCTTNEDFHTNIRFFYFGRPNTLLLCGSLN